MNLTHCFWGFKRSIGFLTVSNSLLLMHLEMPMLRTSEISLIRAPFCGEQKLKLFFRIQIPKSCKDK
jgi:hypothetical protein